MMPSPIADITADPKVTITNTPLQTTLQVSFSTTKAFQFLISIYVAAVDYSYASNVTALPGMEKRKRQRKETKLMDRPRELQ